MVRPFHRFLFSCSRGILPDRREHAVASGRHRTSQRHPRRQQRHPPGRPLIQLFDALLVQLFLRLLGKMLIQLLYPMLDKLLIQLFHPLRRQQHHTPSSSSSSRSTYPTTTRTVPAAPVVTKPQIQPDQPREIYWEDGYKWQIHNATCKTFAKGKGSPTVTPIGEDCPDCGGKTKKPLTDGTIKLIGPVSSPKPAAPETKTGETAKKEDTQPPPIGSHPLQAKSITPPAGTTKTQTGYLTKSPQGTDCKICGGKDGK